MVLLRYVAAYNLFDALNMVFVSADQGSGRHAVRVWDQSVHGASCWRRGRGWPWTYFDAGLHGCWMLVTVWIWVLGVVYCVRFLRRPLAVDAGDRARRTWPLPPEAGGRCPRSGATEPPACRNPRQVATVGCLGNRGPRLVRARSISFTVLQQLRCTLQEPGTYARQSVQRHWDQVDSSERELCRQGTLPVARGVRGDVQTVDRGSGGLLGRDRRHVRVAEEVGQGAGLQLRGQRPHQVVHQRQDEHLGQRAGSALGEARRSGGDHLGGQRAGRAEEADVQAAAHGGLQVRQRAQVVGIVKKGIASACTCR